jgi:phage baseplate assembly protein W
MPIYVGFSTKNVCQVRNISRPGVDGGMGNITQEPRLGKKFRLVDVQLVIQDFLNSFNIKQGDKVGQPGYGTTIWNYVFEPNTTETRSLIENEIRRVANLDPRITLTTIDVYSRENGILIELEMTVQPFNDTVQVGFFLNRFDGTIQQLAQ